MPCSRHAALRCRVQPLLHPNPIVPLNGKAPTATATACWPGPRPIVSSLVKDGDGIWRGTAMKDGKIQKVAVDFKGNVVSP